MSAPATPENEKDKMDFRLPGPWDRCRFPGWGVRNVYLSPIALSVVLSMEDWPSALQVQQELMEALAHLLRLVGHVAAEHGFPLPVVAILDVRDDQVRQTVRTWEGAQDWHRGEFTLFVTDPEDKMQRQGDPSAAEAEGQQPQDSPPPRTVSSLVEIMTRPETLAIPWTAEEVVLDLEAIREKLRQSSWYTTNPGRAQSSLELYIRDEREKGASAERAEEESYPSRLVLRRFKKLRVQGFRGLCGQGKLHEFDLDADLVLISGPNGHGKSSLLDALLLVLSGDHSYLPEDAYHSIVDDNGTPVSEFTIELEAVADVPGQEEGQQREEKEIIIRVQGGPRPDEWTWHWGYEASEKKRYDPATWLFRRRDPEGRADRMERRGWRQRDGRSLALLSAYLNDRRLDDRAQASPQELVGRVLEPLKEPLEAVRKRVDDALESLKKKLEKLEQDEAAYPDERQEQIRQDFAAWVPAWRELMVLLGEGRPDWLPLPAEQAPALWMDWARARLGPGREVTAQTLFQWIRRELETQYNDQARRASQQSGVQATDDTLQQLQQLQNEYNQLQQQREGLLWNYPTLDLDLAWLYPEGEEQPGLPEVFRLLANHIHTWQQGSPVGLDRQVQQELAAVVEERAAFCHQRVHELVTSLRQARRRLRETETRLKELEQKIARLRSLSERLQRLADARGELDRLEREDKQQGWLQDAIGLVEWERRGEERQKERERLAEEQKHLQGLQAELEQLAQPDERVLRFVMEAINRVMVRFAEPGRFWPLRLEGGKLKTADGRRFDHFSSGQRAQTSMAGMVAVQQALIELLGDDFPHRLLLLDDASASYDLANLSREALLWRQLAYHPDRAQRRQIFLATHHEDLTNRQLDLLVPLPGQGTMRALHFVSWDPQTGPQWQTFDVKPPAHVASDDQQARQRLADDLRRELCLSSST